MELNYLKDEDFYLRYLENEAHKLILAGYKNTQDSCSMIMQIMNTSIWPSINWGIIKFENDNITKYYLVKTLWDKKQDEKKMNEPNFNLKLRYNKVSLVPTIQNKQIILSNSYVEKVINKLKFIELKPNPEPKIKEGFAILDGTYYKLLLGEMFNNFCITWREEDQDNWSGLTKFARELLKMFVEIDLKCK
ncbi:hypothetical protein [Acetivibrio cellulolyticus]|uniref:hypothetical protein n=1 Tax=Acetivibrio cellulolyticus TaxID=35830 RepID=UPI0001E30168|nr:hypothetical protein [Acetivibrio cellulolyticus]